MKTSLSWLQEAVPFHESALEFAEKMTISGSMVEEIIVERREMQGIISGKILTLEKHPDADKLVILSIDCGQTLTIVSGAPNLAIGQIVPVATVGSTLPNGTAIEATSFRGVMSYGMLCSIEELGLTHGDFPDAPDDGVYVFPENTPIGQDVGELMGIRETIFDFEITSNRPDCLSVEGLAREAAVTLNAPFTPFDAVVKGEGKLPTQGTVSVAIEAPDLCRRFVARVVNNIKIGPSPLWLRQRLRTAGVRPISNIVDITNYVMLAVGQPLHAYDLRDLAGPALVARRATSGETIRTLDEQERQLTTSMLVIGDAERAIGIAGVMGGYNSEVKNDTTTIVFEAANFLAPSVRQTSTALGLRTEASARFEKGLSPENCRRAIDLACALVEQLACGDVAPDTIDVYPEPETARTILLEPEKIVAILGEPIEASFMEETLTALGFVRQGATDEWTIPWYRQDIEVTADLAEEVARFYGYNNITPVLSIGDNLTVGGLSDRQKLNEKIINRMLAAGFFEAITYPFENERLRKDLGLDQSGVMVLRNPLNEDFTQMRTGLAGALFQVGAYNTARGNATGRLFERGRSYHQAADGTPYEIERLAALVMIESAKKQASFLQTKGVVESLLQSLRLTAIRFVASTETPYLHPGMQASIVVAGEVLGVLGVIHPVTSSRFGLADNSVFFELNADRLLDLASDEVTMQPIPRFPAVVRDIALLADREVEVATIMAWFEAAGGEHLVNVELFDVYEGERIGQDKRSLAFHLTFRDQDGTLNDEKLAPSLAAIDAMLSEKGLVRR